MSGEMRAVEALISSMHACGKQLGLRHPIWSKMLARLFNMDVLVLP